MTASRGRTWTRTWTRQSPAASAANDDDEEHRSDQVTSHQPSNQRATTQPSAPTARMTSVDSQPTHIRATSDEQVSVVCM